MPIILLPPKIAYKVEALTLEFDEEATLAYFLRILCAQTPSIADLVLNGNQLASSIEVFINAVNVATLNGLKTLVHRSDEITLFMKNDWRDRVMQG